jgi:hypothetical protein
MLPLFADVGHPLGQVSDLWHCARASAPRSCEVQIYSSPTHFGADVGHPLGQPPYFAGPARVPVSRTQDVFELDSVPALHTLVQVNTTLLADRLILEVVQEFQRQEPIS